MLTLALVGMAPLAHAQVVIQTPSVPGARLSGPPASYPDDYWRRGPEGGEEWRRRAEFREEEHRREEWQRAHCVRDYQGQEFCRR